MSTGDLVGAGQSGDSLKEQSFSQCDLPRDIAFLKEEGFPTDFLREAAAIAAVKGLAANEVLVERGALSRSEYLRRLAAWLGVDHLDSAPPRGNIGVEKAHSDPLTALFRFPGIMRCRPGAGPGLIIAPEPRDTARLIANLRDKPELARDIALIDPATLRRAWFGYFQREILHQACEHLFQRYPSLSAKSRLSAGQKIGCIAAGLAAFAGLAIAPVQTGLLVAIILTLAYLASSVLRLAMILRLDSVGGPALLSDLSGLEPEDYPIYTILAPLYKEANQVKPLIDALDRLQWPRNRREVLLVCESADAETLAAIRATTLPQGFHLVICPRAKPYTKPKALNFALPLATGEFTVIFDAEDRPHPLQLVEAFHAFRAESTRLACLQAPLAIHNGDRNWLTGMFELEYDILFRGTLPVLAKMGAPLPLGGTSNHFRTAILRLVGAWDPYNVTEDADLGVRLARLGYRCGTIALPTLEEAPPTFSGWRKQRARWLKGWMQTVLVHSRMPVRTIRQIGFRGTLIMHLLLTLSSLSALIHPIMLVLLCSQLWGLWSGHNSSFISTTLFTLGIFNLAVAYTSYAGFAMVVLSRFRRRKLKRRRLVGIVPYWILIAIAAWEAAWQLLFKPFHWEKTEHGLAKIEPYVNIED